MKTLIKKLRRGFTIVELVIVIAVIAILAAVLIPTFANLINSANESVDLQTVKNLNTIVSAYDTVGDIETVNDALDGALENGYSVSALTPTSEGNVIVYDSVSNRFALLSDDYSEVIYKDSATEKEDADDWSTSTTWIFLKTSDVTATSGTYDLTSYTNSIILVGDEWNGADVTVSTGVSLYDYTNSVTLNKVTVDDSNITSLKANINSGNKSAIAKTTTAYTESVTSITINVKSVYLSCTVTNYTVKNYSTITGTTTVTGSTNYSEYGTSATYDATSLTTGLITNYNTSVTEVVIKASSSTVFVDNTNTLSSDSIIITTADITVTVGDTGTVTVENGTEKYPYLIESVSEWLAFRNSGKTTGGYNWSVTCDLDFSDTTDYVDITTFTGSIDFNNHSVSGVAFTSCEDNWTGDYGGLFYTLLGDATVSNLNYEIPNISTDCTVKLVVNIGDGYTRTNATLYNISITGSTVLTTGNGSTFVQCMYGISNLVFENCTNYASIMNTGKATGVFLGKAYEGTDHGATTDMTVSFINCYNYGTIQNTSEVASMLIGNPASFTYMSTDDVTVEGCVNYGNIYGASNANLFCGNTKYDSIASSLESSGALVNGTTRGVCAKMTVGTISTEDSVFTLSTIPSTVSSATTFTLTFSAFMITEGGAYWGTFIIYEYTFTADELANATVYSYSFKDYDSSYELKQVDDTDLYTTEIEGETYYVVNYSDSTYGHYYLNGGSVSVTLNAYNDNGDLLSVWATTL